MTISNGNTTHHFLAHDLIALVETTLHMSNRCTYVTHDIPVLGGWFSIIWAAGFDLGVTTATHLDEGSAIGVRGLYHVFFLFFCQATTPCAFVIVA